MTAINTAQAHTQLWIEKVVIGLNFCPFAAKEVKLGSIAYKCSQASTMAQAIEDVALCINMLNTQPSVETAFLIFENNYSSFRSYLELVSKAEKWLKKNNYQGVYQLASFHPQYIFEGSNEQDAANYTNRSPYPMLHFLREESLSKVISNHKNTNAIPSTNIALARQKGLQHMQMLLSSCKK